MVETGALVLTASDLAPLREQPGHMAGAIAAAERAIAAQHRGGVLHQHLGNDPGGEIRDLRVSVTAAEGGASGLRVFARPPATRAFLLLDAATGAIVALMDYGVLNSLRVGAIAGAAARALAPAGARKVGLLGAGWQAQPQLDALRAALPALAEVRVYSPTPAKRATFAQAMTARLGLPVVPVGSAREALEGAEVVDLCAPGHGAPRAPIFESDWIAPGALVIAMAPAQCPLDFAAGARVIAASWEALTVPQAWPPFDRLIAAGRLAQATFTPLGAIAAGDAPARRHAQERVVYCIEGASAADLWIAQWGHDWARANGHGMPFDLSRPKRFERT